MSNKIPSISSSRLIGILRKKGFVVVRQSGSHVILRHPNGLRTTVPMHKGRDLGKGLLHQVMKDVDLSVVDLKDKWNRFFIKTV